MKLKYTSEVYKYKVQVKELLEKVSMIEHSEMNNIRNTTFFSTQLLNRKYKMSQLKQKLDFCP